MDRATVGALLAEEMPDRDGLAGLPTALFTVGSALTALLVGRATQRAGRRIGLGLGFAAGGLGAIGVVVAAATELVPLLFVALFIYGAGSATNLQARYAGTDLAASGERVTGRLVDRYGRTPMAIAGGVTLLFAGVIGATAPERSLTGLVVALVLLGIGWNIGLISGTALVIDGTAPATRPRIQGTIDVLIALSGAEPERSPASSRPRPTSPPSPSAAGHSRSFSFQSCSGQRSPARQMRGGVRQTLVRESASFLHRGPWSPRTGDARSPARVDFVQLRWWRPW